MDDRPPEVEEWIGQWTPTQQEQVRWFADRVHAADERVAEAPSGDGSRSPWRTPGTNAVTAAVRQAIVHQTEMLPER